MSLPIEHVSGEGFFIDVEGERVAEMTYAPEREGLVVLDHTWVSDTMRGRGIARQLLEALVAWARKSHIRVRPTCSYAIAEFRKDASIRDVLAD